MICLLKVVDETRQPRLLAVSSMKDLYTRLLNPMNARYINLSCYVLTQVVMMPFWLSKLQGVTCEIWAIQPMIGWFYGNLTVSSSPEELNAIADPSEYCRHVYRQTRYPFSLSTRAPYNQTITATRGHILKESFASELSDQWYLELNLCKWTDIVFTVKFTPDETPTVEALPPSNSIGVTVNIGHVFWYRGFVGQSHVQFMFVTLLEKFTTTYMYVLKRAMRGSPLGLHELQEGFNRSRKRRWLTVKVKYGGECPKHCTSGDVVTLADNRKPYSWTLDMSTRNTSNASVTIPILYDPSPDLTVSRSTPQNCSFSDTRCHLIFTSSTGCMPKIHLDSVIVISPSIPVSWEDAEGVCRRSEKQLVTIGSGSKLSSLKYFGPDFNDRITKHSLVAIGLKKV